MIFCPIKTIFKPFNNNKNNQNMETKKYYEAPETTLVDFQAEGILCASGEDRGVSGVLDQLLEEDI